MCVGQCKGNKYNPDLEFVDFQKLKSLQTFCRDCNGKSSLTKKNEGKASLLVGLNPYCNGKSSLTI